MLLPVHRKKAFLAPLMDFAVGSLDTAGPAFADYYLSNRFDNSAKKIEDGAGKDLFDGSAFRGGVQTPIIGDKPWLKYEGAQSLHHAVTRPLTTDLVGGAAKGMANRIGSSVPLNSWRASLLKAKTPLAGFKISDPHTLLPYAGTIARGVGAGVATVGANIANEVIPGLGNPNTDFDAAGPLDRAVRGVRLSVAGAAGGTPLGPWGAISGAILNPAQDLLSQVRDWYRTVQDEAWSAKANSPEAIRGRIDAAHEAANVSSDWKNIGRTTMMGAGAAVGLAGIAALVHGWRQRKKQQQDIAPMNFQPKLASWVWQGGEGAGAQPPGLAPAAPPAPGGPLGVPTIKAPTTPAPAPSVQGAQGPAGAAGAVGDPSGDAAPGQPATGGAGPATPAMTPGAPGAPMGAPPVAAAAAPNNKTAPPKPMGSSGTDIFGPSTMPAGGSLGHAGLQTVPGMLPRPALHSAPIKPVPMPTGVSMGPGISAPHLPSPPKESEGVPISRWVPHDPSKFKFNVPAPLTSPMGSSGDDSRNLAANKAMAAPGGANFWSSKSPSSSGGGSAPAPAAAPRPAPTWQAPLSASGMSDIERRYGNGIAGKVSYGAKSARLLFWVKPGNS